MTISAVRKSSNRRKGFTLLEIIVVLALTMLVIGGAIGAMYLNRDEARLKGSINDIEMLAKRARTVAVLQQRPYALEITREGVEMMPLAEAMIDPGERKDWLQEDGVYDGWLKEEEMGLLVRRWASTDWLPLKRDETHVWRFDPDGVCEPIGLRIQLENGNWISTSFHPLSAAPSDTEAYIE